MISRDEKRRRIYSAVYLYLVHNNVFSRMRGLFNDVNETVETCKNHALAIVERNSRNVDVYRLREFASWDLYQTEVVQRSMRTMDAFMRDTIEFIELATGSMSNMMNQTQMEFVLHAREGMMRELQTRFDEKETVLSRLLDPGAFLTLQVTKPMIPMNAIALRDAIRSIDAAKVAQATLNSPGSTTALALKSLIEKEMQTLRRSEEVRSVDFEMKIGREYVSDAQMRARVADTTEELDRVILTWCAACSQRVAVFYLVQSMMDYLQSLRSQINDAVAEVLQDPKYGGEMVFRLIMSNSEEHELLLKVMEQRSRDDGEYGVGEEGEQWGDDSFAQIMGNYVDDELRSVYESVAGEQVVSQAEVSARLDRMFRRGETGNLPTIPVKVVTDALDATLSELVTSIAAQRLEVDTSNEAAVNTSASIMLGIGVTASKKRGRPSSSSAAAAAAPAAPASTALVATTRHGGAEDATAELFSTVDRDIVAYTNAELMRSILRRDILRTFEERVFNCIASPYELTRAKSSSVMSIVRGTQGRIKATKKPTKRAGTKVYTVSATGEVEENEVETAPPLISSAINYNLHKLPVLSRLAFCPNSAIMQSRMKVLVRITSTNDTDYETKSRTDITRSTILHSADRRR